MYQNTISGRWWDDTLKEIKNGSSEWLKPAPTPAMDLLELEANRSYLEQQIAHWGEEILNNSNSGAIKALGEIIEIQTRNLEAYEKEISRRSGMIQEDNVQINNETDPQLEAGNNAGTSTGKNNGLLYIAIAAGILFAVK